MKKVFISHSSKDKLFVDMLVNDLLNHDIVPWYDKWCMNVGDSLHKKIGDGITDCDYMIVVISPNSLKSKWVQQELNAGLARALEDDSVFILPIFLEGTDDSLPVFLKDKIYADFRSSYNSGLLKLIESIFADNDRRSFDKIMSSKKPILDYSSNRLIKPKPKYQNANSPFRIKAIVFNFEGTMVIGKDNSSLNVWERIFQSVGLSINDLACISREFANGIITYKEFRERIAIILRKQKLNKSHLEKIANDYKLIPGVMETVESLTQYEVKLYITSGNIRYLIRKMLGRYSINFDKIMANEILFDTAGNFSWIIPTKYDYEGKATFIKQIIDDNNIQIHEILYVGSTHEDHFVKKSGVKTLCVNPLFTNPSDSDIWDYSIRSLEDFSEIYEILI